MSNRGLAAEGAARVVRHQRVLWWVFAVSLSLAWIGSLPLRAAAGSLLDHSLASAGIAGTVDFALLVEALAKPGMRLGTFAGGSAGVELVYFVFLLFVGGGALVVYRDDRRLTRGEFFEGCGRYFFRLLRLSLWSLLPLALVGVVLAVTAAIAGQVAEANPLESRALLVRLAGLVLAALLFLFVRLWFDVAQARLVVHDERRMWRTAIAALRTSVGSLAGLSWLYLRVGLLVLAAHAAGAWLWLRVPGRAFALSFLLLQLVLLAQLGGRLWLRASVVAWYADSARARTAIESVTSGDAAPERAVVTPVLSAEEAPEPPAEVGGASEAPAETAATEAVPEAAATEATASGRGAEGEPSA